MWSPAAAARTLGDMIMASMLVQFATFLTAAGVWPIPPPHQVVHGFDPPAQAWQAGHRGVDLNAGVGAVVATAEAGTVSFAGSIAGVPIVVVAHGPTRTTYQPVLASVRRGDLVAAGAPIGRLVGFGSHCLPRACLHWGLIEGRDHYLDPLTLLGGGQQVRLLPLKDTFETVESTATAWLRFTLMLWGGPARRPLAVDLR